MSDAQLILLLQMILTGLTNNIDKLEQELPNDFREISGGSNILLDPLRVDYPILHGLYELRYNLMDGIDELKKPEPSK